MIKWGGVENTLVLAFPFLFIEHFTRLSDFFVVFQCVPKNRISASDAMSHVFFSDLPKEIFSLPNGRSYFFTRFFLSFFSYHIVIS